MKETLTRVAAVCVLPTVVSAALAHSPAPDADLDDWCLSSAPRVENTLVELLPFAEIAIDVAPGGNGQWWDPQRATTPLRLDRSLRPLLHRSRRRLHSRADLRGSGDERPCVRHPFCA